MNISPFNPVNKGNLTVTNTNYSMYPAGKMSNRIRIYNNNFPQQRNDPLSNYKELITNILNENSYSILYNKLTHNINGSYSAYLPEISLNSNITLDINNIYNQNTQQFESPPNYSFTYNNKTGVLDIYFDSDINTKFTGELLANTPNKVNIIYQLSYY